MGGSGTEQAGTKETVSSFKESEHLMRLHVGGVLKRVNLVIFFLQADSISIKGIYPGYENKKPKKMRLTPYTRNLKFLKIFTSV